MTKADSAKVLMNYARAAEVLQAGGMVVLRTDTVYGVLAQAGNQAAVEKVYRIKGRDEHKSPIVLISSYEQMFDQLDLAHRSLVLEHWPGPVSIIVPSTESPVWIRRDNDSVAYRMPADDRLRLLIESTGPLIAPSANRQGLPVATTIAQARQYFGNSIDLYIDGGEVVDISPSQLLRLGIDGSVDRLR